MIQESGSCLVSARGWQVIHSALPLVTGKSVDLGRGSCWRPAGVCVSPFRAGIKHGPTLAGVVTSVAGVVTVGHMEPYYLSVWTHILIDLWLSSRA